MQEIPLIRTTERKAFYRCPQQWKWSYVDGLRAKRKPADALWFGIGIHEALAPWYGEGFNRGPEPVTTWNKWVGDEIRYIKANLTQRDRQMFDEPVYLEAGELGRQMLTHYLDWYGDDPEWEILAIEQPFEIDLVREDEVIAIFVGRLDGALLDHEDGEFYLLENKSAATIRTAHLPLDPQAGGYFAVATIVLRDQGILGPKEYINGIEYNFLRKARPDLRERNKGGAYLNKDGSVSKKQPPKPFHREPVDRSPREVNQQLRRITDEVVIMNKIRSGELPVTKNVTDLCPNCRSGQCVFCTSAEAMPGRNSGTPNSLHTIHMRTIERARANE